MTTVRFTPFGGLIPKTDPSMLPAAAAQVAENCRFSSGQLEAYNAPLQVYAPAKQGIRTIYRYGQAVNSDTDYWFTFAANVDVVKGAIANDTEERTFYTGDGYPKVTTAARAISSVPYPSNYWRLGLPAPSDTIIATVSGAPTSETALAETRVYIYTFVSALGEESGPSAPSNEVDLKLGQTISLILGGPPSGAYDTVAKRIYRSVAGSSGTDYLFVAEVAAYTNSYDDTVLADSLGEVIPSLDYAQLPDLARGLTGMANGMMAAHTDYDVYFCAPYKPYAWPESYIQTVDYPIVGMASFGTSLVVLTTGIPYIMSGTDPASVTVEKLAVPYACLSKKSIVSALGGVIYAAADGLVCIDSSGPRVLTDQLFTRREWKLLNPSTMLCAIWDERIFMFCEKDGVPGGYILDAANGLTTTSIYATAAFTDPVTGSLFLAVNDKIVKWDDGAAEVCRWKSRRETLPMPKNFAYGQVLATAYPLTIKIYADGALAHTHSVTSDAPFRLPSGFRARYWEVELLLSVGRALYAALADSTQELQNV